MPRIPTDPAQRPLAQPVASAGSSVSGQQAALSARAPAAAMAQGVAGMLGQGQQEVQNYLADKRAQEEAADLSRGLAEYANRIEQMDLQFEQDRLNGKIDDLETEYERRLQEVDEGFEQYLNGRDQSGVRNIRWKRAGEALKQRMGPIRASAELQGTRRILNIRETETRQRFEATLDIATNAEDENGIRTVIGEMRGLGYYTPEVLDLKEQAALNALSVAGYERDRDAALLSNDPDQIVAALDDINSRLEAGEYEHLPESGVKAAQLQIKGIRSDVVKGAEAASKADEKEAQKIRRTLAAEFEYEIVKGTLTPESIRERAVDAQQKFEFLRKLEEYRLKNLEEPDEKAQVPNDSAYLVEINNLIADMEPGQSDAVRERLSELHAEGAISDTFFQRHWDRAVGKRDTALDQEMRLLLRELETLGGFTSTGTPRADAESDLYVTYMQEEGPSLGGMARDFSQGLRLGGGVFTGAAAVLRGGNAENRTRVVREKIDTAQEFNALVDAMYRFVENNPTASPVDLRNFRNELLTPTRKAAAEVKFDGDFAASVARRAETIRPAQIDRQTEARFGR